MIFAEIKKAMTDYATSVENGVSTVNKNTVTIRNITRDMYSLEDKWTDTEGKTLEDSINEITDPTVKASYLGELSLLRSEKNKFFDELMALDALTKDMDIVKE